MLKQSWRNQAITKIPVEIILSTGQRIQHKYPVDGERVIIKKGKKGYEGKEWAPKFTRGCIITWISGFLFLKKFNQKLVVMEGADHCINFSQQPLEIPTWDRRTAQEYFNANVLKQAGKVEVVSKVPIIYYIGFLMLILLIILQLAGSRIRL